MTNVLVLKEENKMSRLLKDERGMTLVELLATVVILAIIAAIGVTAIGQVIQNTKEDSGVANVQQAMNAAKLYQSTNANTAKPGEIFNLETVLKGGYLEVPESTWKKAAGTSSAAGVEFKVQDNGSLKISVPADSIQAGKKSNQPFEDKSNDEVLALDRAGLFATPTGP